MKTVELRNIINEQLAQIDDEGFLNALKTLIEFKTSDNDADFEKRWEDAITVEEARKISIAHLKTIQWKK